MWISRKNGTGEVTRLCHSDEASSELLKSWRPQLGLKEQAQPSLYFAQAVAYARRSAGDW